MEGVATSAIGPGQPRLGAAVVGSISGTPDMHGRTVAVFDPQESAPGKLAKK
jgi:hypothetical protein